MQTYHHDINSDFTCKHCGNFVSSQTIISGVVNRNHCPYCLYSRHLDLFKAGDRLNACKALMKPCGLTLKKSHDKYVRDQQGELMLTHICTACGDLSINRVAADDDPVRIMSLLTQSHSKQSNLTLMRAFEKAEIDLLQEQDRRLVSTQLFGAIYQEQQDNFLR